MCVRGYFGEGYSGFTRAYSTGLKYLFVLWVISKEPAIYCSNGMDSNTR